jgi:serine phosphatase RsbU (regulator of sigma subunit)
LVSMLGTAFLNEIVPLLDAQSQLSAGNILNELRTKVKIAFKQTGKIGEQKEGMDIALCLLDPTDNQLHYAGAYNPLYIIRDRQLLEVNADRMPIGIHRKERPFSSHELPFQHGDMLYLFTDGFVDQAGEQGIGGFSKQRFQQLLLDIHHEPVFKQKELLLRRFEAWKGNLPQTDDILILGIRL